MLGEGSSAAARLNEQGAGAATWAQGFPELQSQLPEKAEVQFYSEKKNVLDPLVPLNQERWWWYCHGPASLGSGWISHYL